MLVEVFPLIIYFCRPCRCDGIDARTPELNRDCSNLLTVCDCRTPGALNAPLRGWAYGCGSSNNVCARDNRGMKARYDPRAPLSPAKAWVRRNGARMAYAALLTQSKVSLRPHWWEDLNCFARARVVDAMYE
jgi:hypothetical protein